MFITTPGQPSGYVTGAAHSTALPVEETPAQETPGPPGAVQATLKSRPANKRCGRKSLHWCQDCDICAQLETEVPGEQRLWPWAQAALGLSFEHLHLRYKHLNEVYAIKIPSTPIYRLKNLMLRSLGNIIIQSLAPTDQS